jgi:hypothetical protein
VKRVLLLCCAALVTVAAAAQTPRALPPSDRLVNLPTHVTVGPSTLQVLFTHRFTQTVDGAGGYDLFGLDSAANIGIGLALGLGRDLEVEVYRASFLKEYEGTVKWTLARQGAAFPVGVAVRAGADYRGAKGIDERWSAIAQVIVARRVGEKLDVFLIPSYASDTPSLTNAANLAVAAMWQLPKRWHLAIELVPANRDAVDGELAWALGVTKRVPGHEFLFYLGNSPATTTSLIVGSDLPGGFGAGDVRLGFNIVRRFPE